MATPKITDLVLYVSTFDIFAQSAADPLNNQPSAAIVTGVNAGSVNLTIFPNGRQPVTRDNVPYFMDETDPYKPRYKFPADPNFVSFGYSNSDTVANDPLGYINLFFTGTLGTGTIVFTDPAMTTPYIDRPYIADFQAGGGHTFSVNQTTGELTQIR